MVSRLFDWVKATRGSSLNTKHFRIIQAVLFVGLILSIVGGTSMSYSSDGTYQPHAITKASILLYLAGFIAITAVIVVSRQAFTPLSQVPHIERRLLVAILLAWPFLLTRIICSILGTFLHNKTFSMVRGDLGVYVTMAVLEEFVVIGIFLALGFFLVRNNSPATGEIANRAWKSRAADSVEPERIQHGEEAEQGMPLRL
ncbi:hypothetical protein CGGC5_v008710 [Colletotrichum fructicola Nara gc5]|uniref:DUF7702 domain-containing protein n=1 Tax=Colletotrichum fructicola (strain Nara gc5) TaxID=1213859 RepID=A0A7J6J2E7_COLFN|nr:hypothetical protein CFRS1_v010848 [Colletotrichum fructicola]KAF4482731.1 hypothetical protein CGGC5_v008710 [Colletotrichum fructicola Nara gc5]KAF5509764.1 hypothetical protein CGCF413_v004023 [Colletotrichum fructicola]